MANLLDCTCTCGYNGEAWVASTRAGFGKSFWFPFMCQICKEVRSINLLKNPLRCQDCGSKDLIQYGLKIPDPPKNVTVRLLDRTTAGRRALNRQLKELTSYHVAMAHEGTTQCTYGLLHQDYDCPKCKNVSLRFTLSALVD
jgi:DNA-directed RNA polymerase subunit RPC12/RpoP